MFTDLSTDDFEDDLGVCSLKFLDCCSDRLRSLVGKQISADDEDHGFEIGEVVACGLEGNIGNSEKLVSFVAIDDKSSDIGISVPWTSKLCPVQERAQEFEGVNTVRNFNQRAIGYGESLQTRDGRKYGVHDNREIAKVFLIVVGLQEFSGKISHWVFLGEVDEIPFLSTPFSGFHVDR